MDHVHEHSGIVLSDDAARGGVTGHHVRYVLLYGLLGVIAAFTAINVYFHYDALSAWLASLAHMDVGAVLANVAPVAVLVAAAIIVAFGLLNVWRMIDGPSENETQRGMRLRVVSQFAIVLALMAGLYFIAR